MQNINFIDSVLHTFDFYFHKEAINKNKNDNNNLKLIHNEIQTNLSCDIHSIIYSYSPCIHDWFVWTHFASHKQSIALEWSAKSKLEQYKVSKAIAHDNVHELLDFICKEVLKLATPQQINVIYACVLQEENFIQRYGFKLKSALLWTSQQWIMKCTGYILGWILFHYLSNRLKNQCLKKLTYLVPFNKMWSKIQTIRGIIWFFTSFRVRNIGGQLNITFANNNSNVLSYILFPTSIYDDFIRKLQTLLFQTLRQRGNIFIDLTRKRHDLEKMMNIYSAWQRNLRFL